MKFLLILSLLSCSLPLSAEEPDTTSVFLNKFEKFVAGIEKNDSTIDWQRSNAVYKQLRTEYRNAHKKRMTSEQYARYNKLKTRYVKQVSLKKVGQSIESKTSSISSAVRGAIEGVIGK